MLEVMEANHNRRPLSLDRPAGGEDSDEAPPSEWVGEEDERFELVEGRIALDAALPYLEERERVVLRLRFVEDMTQSQIAERIGHSQMHVSRILRRALARIRKRIEEERGLDGERELGGGQAGEANDQVVAVARLVDGELVGELLERATQLGHLELAADLCAAPFSIGPSRSSSRSRSRRGRAARDRRQSARAPRRRSRR